MKTGRWHSIDRDMLITMIREDEELRKEIVNVLLESSDIVTKTYLDIQLAKLAKEFDRKLTAMAERLTKDFDRKLAEQSKEFDRKLTAMAERLAKDFDRKLAEQSKEFDRKLTAMAEQLTKDFDRKLAEQSRILTKSFEDRILALGGRWGIQNEFAIREGMRAILEEEFKVKVKHWHYRRRIPAIHPRRSEYELDIIITDKKVIVIEIKSSVYREQIEAFMDNVRAYEYIKKCKVTKKMIISPYIDIEARRIAKREGIEVMTPPIEYYKRMNDLY